MLQLGELTKMSGNPVKVFFHEIVFRTSFRLLTFATIECSPQRRKSFSEAKMLPFYSWKKSVNPSFIDGKKCCLKNRPSIFLLHLFHSIEDYNFGTFPGLRFGLFLVILQSLSVFHLEIQLPCLSFE